MAQVKQSKTSKKRSKAQDNQAVFEFPLGKINGLILTGGVLLLIAGYILMALPDNPDDFMTLTLAPIILVFSFVVVIPFGLIYREKKEDSQ